MQETIPELNRSLAGYAFDVQKARDLLKQAGYQGQPIKVNTPIARYTLDKELGEAVAGMLENVGVKVEFKASEWGGYAQPLFSGKASGISLIGMGNIVFLPDWVFTLWLLPGGQGEAYTKGRPANWESDVARLALMARDNRERQPLLDKLQAEAIDFAPWILLVNLKDIYALSDRVIWEPYPNEMRNLKDARPRN
jgi:peptide/nickel transport system substrate-binding protein